MLDFFSQLDFVSKSFIAGVLASLACGLGVLPLLIRRIDFKGKIGIGYGFAGGLMFSASVYNLLLPAITISNQYTISALAIVQTLGGLLLGCLFLWYVQHKLEDVDEHGSIQDIFGGRLGVLVFVAMFFHSVPEGVAVGVGFASPEHVNDLGNLGVYVALAIAIHNIPEGLAVALPMHAQGVSIKRCFWFAVLTSIPQPLAAVPASYLVWLFKPLMLPFFGFAAGAMMYLVVVEMIPHGLESQSREKIAWSFMLGFSLMVLVQVVFS